VIFAFGGNALSAAFYVMQRTSRGG